MTSEENEIKPGTVKYPEEAPQENEPTIEEALEELKGILASMQDNTIPLEDSFAFYEKGMKLIHYCSSRIDGVEKKIEKISADGTITPFDDPV